MASADGRRTPPRLHRESVRNRVAGHRPECESSSDAFLARRKIESRVSRCHTMWLSACIRLGRVDGSRCMVGFAGPAWAFGAMFRTRFRAAGSLAPWRYSAFGDRRFWGGVHIRRQLRRGSGSGAFSAASIASDLTSSRISFCSDSHSSSLSALRVHELRRQTRDRVLLLVLARPRPSSGTSAGPTSSAPGTGTSRGPRTRAQLSRHCSTNGLKACRRRTTSSPSISSESMP